MTQQETVNNADKTKTQEGVQNLNTKKDADVSNATLRLMMFNSGMYCMHDYISVLNKDK